MMRLPSFGYHAPKDVAEVAKILAGEGPDAMIVAGGTDLYPNMKRRHQTPKTLVSLRHVDDLRGVSMNGSVSIGSNETLRSLEQSGELKARLPALHTAVASISTPQLRNMGTIGGNVCLDTRCNYYNQSWEWRRAIDFCMKCDGETCWVAPSSSICWAVNSSDSVPVFIALGATFTLVGPEGERTIPALEMFGEDGIEYLTKRKDEVLTRIDIPDQGSAQSVYRKVRRRGSFDFPVAAVAARVDLDGDEVKDVSIILNAVGPKPVVCTQAQDVLLGNKLTDDLIEEAAKLAARGAKPLDNTDTVSMWRKKVVQVEVKRALVGLR
ncbi:MAG: xanthine dehydrogenase family protein subunit M [Planctomycetota bacterium]|nr:xanthine dehydrogenase family protein subunit M [Planctomycetota bacterium]